MSKETRLGLKEVELTAEAPIEVAPTVPEDI